MRQFKQPTNLSIDKQQLDFFPEKTLHLSTSHVCTRRNFKGKIGFPLLNRKEIGEIFSGNAGLSLSIPFFESRVHAGLPVSNDEVKAGPLDLNDYLLPHKATTFFVRATGDSMINAGIFSEDMLIVDRSLAPAYGNIVIAILNGEMTVKRLEKDKNRILLCAENDEYPDVIIEEEDNFAIWGVVTNVIHSLL